MSGVRNSKKIITCKIFITCSISRVVMLLSDPCILVLDEPTLSLDHEGKTAVADEEFLVERCC